MSTPIYEITVGLSGIIFFVTALIGQRKPPKSINAIYGYRTPKAMKNQENWDIAQKAGMKHMKLAGLFMIITALLVLWIKYLLNFDLITSVVKGWHITVSGDGWIETAIAISVVFASCFYIFYKTERLLK